MRITTVLCAIIVPLVFTACNGEDARNQGDGAATPTAGGAAPAEDMGPVVAEVGDVKVYAKEFEQAAARKTPADGNKLTDDEKKEVLQKLIEEKALYQEARKKGVDQDPKVQKVMINTLLRQEVYGNVRNSDFSQEELRKYFDEHREEFVVPEKVQVKRIFVKAGDQRSADEAKKIAEDLRKQVASNPSKFGDVASQHSEDPYRRRGGDLGFVGKDGKPGIDQAVIDKAFTMEQGQVSEVFEAGGGFNVILVANKRERVERTFEQMRGSVLRKVKNDKYKEMYDTYVAEVTKQYPVKIHEDVLAKVEVEPQKRMPMGPGGPGGPGGGPGMPGLDLHGDEEGGGHGLPGHGEEGEGPGGEE